MKLLLSEVCPKNICKKIYILNPRVFAIIRQAVIFQMITFYRTLMNFWLPTQKNQIHCTHLNEILKTIKTIFIWLLATVTNEVTVYVLRRGTRFTSRTYTLKLELQKNT